MRNRYFHEHSPLPSRRRPESNCVVGNFFSARREHAKAIQYFDRAVRLDKNYLRRVGPRAQHIDRVGHARRRAA